MSRSRKNTSVFVDPSNSHMKKLGSRKFRRKSKVMTQINPDNVPHDKSEVINDYDVCDFRFFMKKGDELYKKGLRK